MNEKTNEPELLTLDQMLNFTKNLSELESKELAEAIKIALNTPL